MWKDKGLQLAMLPTTNNSTIVKSKRDGSVVCHPLVTIGWSCFQPSHWEPQYLYLLSEGKIEEGDIYLDDCNDIRKAVTSVKEYWSNRSSYKKIISSIDPSLNLPQFPNAFIEEYVKRYNSKKSLEVEVEYIIEHDLRTRNKEEEFKEVLVIKEGEISIRFKEEKMYSRSEIEKLCRRASYIGHDIAWCDELHKELVDNWIKENLK